MNFSIAGQDKGDCLIEVTTWAGLTVLIGWLIDLCLMPTLAVFQLYHGMSLLYNYTIL